MDKSIRNINKFFERKFYKLCDKKGFNFECRLQNIGSGDELGVEITSDYCDWKFRFWMPIPSIEKDASAADVIECARVIDLLVKRYFMSYFEMVSIAMMCNCKNTRIYC